MRKSRTAKGENTTQNEETEEPSALTPGELLEQALRNQGSPDQLAVVHDQLKLLGLVMGQAVLLQSLLDSNATVKDKISAARALVAIPTEKPEILVERLRGSIFSGLSAAQLETIIKKVGEDLTPDKLSKLDMEQLIHDIQEKSDAL